MKLIAVILSSLVLVACGGGDETPVADIKASVPHPVANAATVSGGSGVAVHIYQALYGMAPSNAMLLDYTAQATADPSAFARNLASNFSSTSSAALAKLVLDNLNVTTTTVTAVNGQGQSEYAILLDALGQMFTFYGVDARGQIILNATNLLAGLESDPTYGVTAVSYNSQATANLAYSSNSANTVAAAVSTATGTGSTALMGGAKQGTPLSLSGLVSTFAGSKTSGAVDGVGIGASFSAPKGITTDGTNLYVTDSANKKIRKIVIATGAVTTLAGSGGTGAVDGVGAAASFGSNLTGITTDGTNLFVTDTNNYTIRKIVIATGAVSTFAGSGISSAVDGTGTAASFKSPRGITTDGTNLYVTDINNYSIRKIVIATGAVTTLAGSGTSGSVDGTGTAASFKGPYGITTDGTNLYVADSSSNTIRKVVISTGAVTTLAGSGTLASVDGTGSSASFNSPRGITTDGTNIYEVDYGNSTIRKIVISTGAVTTLAGSGAVGSADGTGSAASFNFPDQITTDGASLFVADPGNNVIRKIN